MRYPGLLDRSPALSLVDQTVVDPEGADRDVRRRRAVFVFDAGAHCEAMQRGDVWLDEVPITVRDGGGCKSDANPDARCIGGQRGHENGNRGFSVDIGGGVCIMPDHVLVYPGRGRHCAPGDDASTTNDNDNSGVDRESE